MVAGSKAGSCPVCKKGFKKRIYVLCSSSCGRKVHRTCLESGEDEGGDGEPPPATWTCDTCLQPTEPTNEHGADFQAGVFALLDKFLAQNLEMATEIGGLRAKNCILESQKAELKQLIQELQNNAQFSHVSTVSNVAISPANLPQDFAKELVTTVVPRPPPDRGGEVLDYASATAATASSKRGSGALRPQQQLNNKNKPVRPIITTSDIYVATKDSKSNASAATLVKKHLQCIPGVMDHIEEVIPLKLLNTAVIKCSNSESRILIKDMLEKAIGESHKIEHSRKPRREIKVHDVAFDETFPPKLEDGSVDKDAILCEILAKNNLPEDGFISVKTVETLYAQENHNSRGRISLLVDDKTKEALLGGNGLKVGWSRCRQIEEVCPILQCYKCRGYNHTQATCWLNKKTPEKIICAICTEDHRPKDCPYKNQREQYKNLREHYKCINCVNHNKKQVNLSEQNIFDQNHRADDRYNCQIYVSACKNYEARIARD
jgi:hypothetical protein